jgi:hypothetical protein
MKLDHSESYFSRAVGVAPRKGSSTRNATAAENEYPVGCSGRLTLPGPRPSALPHRLTRDGRRNRTKVRSQSRRARHRVRPSRRRCLWYRLVLIWAEHLEPGTCLLRRDSSQPIFVGATAVEHRLSRSRQSRRRPESAKRCRLFFEHPEDGVSEKLVGLVVCRSCDLVVLLGNVLIRSFVSIFVTT